MVGNPLVGVDGRAALLAAARRGRRGQPGGFAREDARGPAAFRSPCAQAEDGACRRRASSQRCSRISAPIWPGRLTLGGIALGDTWRHPAIKRDDATDGLVPIHKLSQWLAYSLIEPLQTAGIAVTDIDGLTGLAEYRNGGLFVDAGVLACAIRTPRCRPNAGRLRRWWSNGARSPSRCSTSIAPLIRERLGVTCDAFPLARVLEGGTWAAGRRLAREKRPDGSPPIASTATARYFELSSAAEPESEAWGKHGRRHRRRSSAGAAQADPDARQGALDQGLPPAARTRSACCSATRSRATCRSS